MQTWKQYNKWKTNNRYCKIIYIFNQLIVTLQCSPLIKVQHESILFQLQCTLLDLMQPKIVSFSKVPLIIFLIYILERLIIEFLYILHQNKYQWIWINIRTQLFLIYFISHFNDKLTLSQRLLHANTCEITNGIKGTLK